MALQTKTFTVTSNTFTLELTIVENSTSVASNSSSISYTLKLKSTTKDFYQYGLGASISINGSVVASRSRTDDPKVGIDTYSSVTLLSGSTSVNHNNDGNKTISVAYSIDMASASYTPGPMDGTGSVALTYIPRGATITGAVDFTDDSNPRLNYSNPAGGSLKAGIATTSGVFKVSYRAVSGSSYTFKLTEAERNALRSIDTTKNSVSVRFYLQTVVAGKTFTTYTTRTMTIANPSPKVSPTVRDENPDTVALTGNANIIVRYMSAAKIVIGASAVKNATLKSQSATCGSKKITSDGTIYNVESGTFVIAATDSRNNTTTVNVNKTLVQYIKPTCNIGEGVPDALGTFDMSVYGVCFTGSFGKVDNDVSVEYRYRQQFADEWSEWAPMTVATIQNNYTATVTIKGLNYQNTYEFQARVVDKLSSVDSAAKVIKSVPVFDWSETDFNFNVPVYFSGKLLLDLIHPIGSVYTSTDPTPPDELFGGTWQQITNRFLYCTNSSKTTGGSNTINLAHKHTTAGHTLTINEIPSHKHAAPNCATVEVTDGYKYTGMFNVNDNSKGLITMSNYASVGGGRSHSHGNTGSALSNTSGNNMPAYFTVYAWYRTK